MKNAAINNNPDLWRKYLPVPSRDGNKYSRGHVVVGGGGIECTGAAKLVARCALRAGAGLVSVACDRESLPVYATSFQAVMTKLVESAEDFSALIADERVTAVSLGSGAGVSEKTKGFVLATLRMGKKALLDADALSVFAGVPQQLFSAIKSPCVMTPHEGEFQRLFTGSVNFSEGREYRAQQAATLSGAVVVLKGSNTVIAAPDGRMAVNNNATHYLATAGSGDALAGICAGLLAQGMPEFEAACASVWVHAEAASKFGVGLIAEDIAELMPEVLKNILL